MTDLHVHTRFSTDGEADAESYLDIAMLCGESRLGFSEHCDYDYVRRGFEVNLTDLAAMHASLLDLRRRYQGKIEILEGIEFGYSRLAVEDYQRILRQYPFDYVIQSVHAPDGEPDCYFQPYFAGKNKRDAYLTYFRAVSESLDAPYPFQILGHLGYVARNAPYSDPCIRYEDFPEILDEIFSKMIRRGVALELNTNVKTAGTPFLPPLDLLKRYRALGGQFVTLASDAHQARRLYDKFDLLCDALRAAGFASVCWFRNQVRYQESL